MTNKPPTKKKTPEPGPLRLGLAHSLEVLGTFSLLGGVLFLFARRLDWWEAWIILGVYFLIALLTGLWMLRRDPALLKERDRAILKSNVKAWDRFLVSLNLLLTLALFAVIGLDAGRFGWSQVPLWVRILGGLAMLLSFALSLWASSVNTFLSAQVRIQDERGHRAVTNGPYAHLRHPMYLGMILLDLGLPLLFGSWWGLVASAVMIAVVVVRTALEDRTLQKELRGYRQYAQQVRYRLLPGIW